MWWKLAGLTVGTLVLISMVIPIRTHAVRVDLANPPPPEPLFSAFSFSNMVFPPSTIVLIGIILAGAALSGVRIARRAQGRPKNP